MKTETKIIDLDKMLSQLTENEMTLIVGGIIDYCIRDGSPL